MPSTITTPTTTPVQSVFPSLSSRIRGSFHGLAVTDALGAPVEFKTRHTFPLVTRMLPNESFRVHASLIYPDRDIDDEDYIALPPGCFTDDTSMALCLAHSLLDCNGQGDEIHQVRNYLWWFRHGWMSSVGECFDVGEATSSALKQWAGLLKAYDAEYVDDDDEDDEEEVKSNSESAAKSSDNHAAQARKEEEKKQHHHAMLLKVTSRLNAPHRCGNGSLMRVLPCALIARNSEEAVALAIQSSLPTHPHPRCLDSCALYTRLVCSALQGSTKDELASCFAHLISQPTSALDPVLKERFSPYRHLADWRSKGESEIKSSGYVLDTLEAALWAFFTTETFREGAVRVVNLGDDADTVGAVYGGLAGSYYGDAEIPMEWVREMWGKGWEMLEGVVGRIVEQKALVVGGS